MELRKLNPEQLPKTRAPATNPHTKQPWKANADPDGQAERFQWRTWFQDGGQRYRGWFIKFSGDRWWSWNGTVLGQAATEADAKRAIDLNP